MCISLQANVLPSKDVRFYGDGNGNMRGQMSMIRDIHSYKDEDGASKENEVKEQKITSNGNETGDDSKKESKENTKVINNNCKFGAEYRITPRGPKVGPLFQSNITSPFG